MGDRDFLRGLVLGAVLGVVAYSYVRDRLAWLDRELERLDRNFCDHAMRDDAHAPTPAVS